MISTLIYICRGNSGDVKMLSSFNKINNNFHHTHTHTILIAVTTTTTDR